MLLHDGSDITDVGLHLEYNLAFVTDNGISSRKNEHSNRYVWWGTDKTPMTEWKTLNEKFFLLTFGQFLANFMEILEIFMEIFIMEN